MLKSTLFAISLFITSAVVADDIEGNVRLDQIITMSDMMVCDPMSCIMTRTGTVNPNPGNPVGMYLVFNLDYVDEVEISKYRNAIMGHWIAVVNGDEQ